MSGVQPKCRITLCYFMTIDLNEHTPGTTLLMVCMHTEEKTTARFALNMKVTKPTKSMERTRQIRIKKKKKKMFKRLNNVAWSYVCVHVLFPHFQMVWPRLKYSRFVLVSFVCSSTKIFILKYVFVALFFIFYFLFVFISNIGRVYYDNETSIRTLCFRIHKIRECENNEIDRIQRLRFKSSGNE